MIKLKIFHFKKGMENKMVNFIRLKLVLILERFLGLLLK